MSLKSAELFVDEMKVNDSFRKIISSVENEDSLMGLLKEKKYDFDQKDLVRAMADCMTEMDEMMVKMKG
ncbi:MAG: Nif11 family protein [Desulfobacterales bacterium]|nr:Nif11 family protein [Desulfobacterales bacterium]MCP4162852.1 Nif11 family protein [Deltaproteobacteria bacterium]